MSQYGLSCCRTECRNYGGGAGDSPGMLQRPNLCPFLQTGAWAIPLDVVKSRPRWNDKLMYLGSIWKSFQDLHNRKIDILGFFRGRELKNEHTYTHIHIYMWNLLEWLKDCSPASSTMAVYQWKIWESHSCSVHMTGCLRWSSVYARTPKK